MQQFPRRLLTIKAAEVSGGVCVVKQISGAFVLTQQHRYTSARQKPEHNKAEEKVCVFVIESKLLSVINVFKLNTLSSITHDALRLQIHASG